MATNAQGSRFDTLMSAIMFNVFTGNPDSIIFPFLKNHLPYLTQPREPGGWTVYPPGEVSIPQHGMHSLKVDKHPFIKTKHKGARLDILTQEWKDGSPGIEGVRVWIFFDSKTQAESASNEVIKEFQNAGAQVERVIRNNQEKTIIKKGPGDDQWESLSIVLQKGISANEYSIIILFYDDEGVPW